MYQAVLRQFNKQGLSEQSQITLHQIKRALDSIAAKNAGVHEFDHEVAEQIWNQTRDNQVGGSIRLRDYAQTMIKAQNILRNQVQETQKHVRTETDPKRKQELLNDLFSYSQDHRTITVPFGLEQIRDSKEIQQSRYNRSVHTTKSLMFSADVDEREESTDLKVVFFLTLLLLSVQLIAMFHKHHFFTLLGIFLIVSAYVLNYFEKKYVLFLLGWITLSIVLDIVWLVINAATYWNGTEESQHANKIQTGFLRFIVFIVCIEVILKIVIIALLIKYRAVNQNIKKKVNIFGLLFFLDGKPDPHNLIVKALTPGTNPFEA